jgi:hypothetical protein
MNVDGSNPRTLSGSGTANLDPTFAPNGDKIYFRQAEPRPHEHRWDLFSMGIDGSNLTQLTHEGFYSIYSPSLSPDGKSMRRKGGTHLHFTSRWLSIRLNTLRNHRGYFDLAFQESAPLTKSLCLRTTCRMESAFSSWRLLAENEKMTTTFTR